MIINTGGINNITVPYNNIYTSQYGNNVYNIPNCVGILNGTMIYYLPSGIFIFRNSTSNIVLPSIFTPSVINSVYETMYEYYISNNTSTPSTYNAAYIDSSNNVYLGYYDGTNVYGMQFLSGSTNINGTGLFGIKGYVSTNSTSFTKVFDFIFYAKLTKPTVTYTMSTSNTSYAVTGYITLDGVASTQESTTSSSAVQYTYQFSTNDSIMNKHEICGYLKTASSSVSVGMTLISLY